MKYLIGVLLLGMVACTKVEVAADGIVGNWNWVQSQGGIAGITIKANENNKRTMFYGGDLTYRFFENGVEKSFGTYKLTTGKSITSTEVVPLIELSSNGIGKMSYHISSDTLYLFDEVYDGFGHTYVRAK